MTASLRGRACGALLVLIALTGPLLAQGRQTFTLKLPQVSPRAEASQAVGPATIRLVYHRPAVNGRTVWGGLVPYGQVWRTGANENTLIVFSHDVSVEGKPLPAGSYGLHTLPGEEEWQIIFSRDTEAWGSFNYDEAEDALRVTVKPEAVATHEERLAFSFDDPDEDSVTVALRWEKLRVPFEVEVDSERHTLASIREQLKGLAAFGWQGWDQAASYCLQRDVNLEEALEWSDRSIQNEPRFANMSTKAQILQKLERGDEADQLMERAVAIGSAGDLHNYARTLLGQGRREEALAVFQRNVDQNSDAWFVELGLARGYSALGRFDEAVEAMKVAVGKAPDNQKAYVQGLVERLEREEDIN